MQINTQPVKVGQALEMMKTLWKSGLRRRAVMMHGAPGIGKTSVAEQFAKWIGDYETEQKGEPVECRFYDVRMTTTDMADLRGLPFYDLETKETVWFRPQDLPSMGPAVLMIDELSATPEHMQATVYGLLQERRVGPHHLPDDVFIIGAGNRVTDNAVAHEIGSALSDRMLHLDIEVDPKSWIQDYAVPKGIHPTVLAFIEQRNDRLHTLEADLAQADRPMISATPRSWEEVSRILYAVEDRAMRIAFINGLIGEEIATEFVVTMDEFEGSVRIQDILAEDDEDKRIRMYPVSRQAITTLGFSLAGAVTRDNVDQCLRTLIDLRKLVDTDKRTKEDREQLDRIPLKELATAAGEIFFIAVEKKFGGEWSKLVLDAEHYWTYSQMRKEDGVMG